MRWFIWYHRLSPAFFIRDSVGSEIQTFFFSIFPVRSSGTIDLTMPLRREIRWDQIFYFMYRGIQYDYKLSPRIHANGSSLTYRQLTGRPARQSSPAQRYSLPYCRVMRSFSRMSRRKIAKLYITQCPWSLDRLVQIVPVHATCTAKPDAPQHNREQQCFLSFLARQLTSILWTKETQKLIALRRGLPGNKQKTSFSRVPSLTSVPLRQKEA